MPPTLTRLPDFEYNANACVAQYGDDLFRCDETQLKFEQYGRLARTGDSSRAALRTWLSNNAGATRCHHGPGSSYRVRRPPACTPRGWRRRAPRRRP